jgi:hypothetical protein
MTNTAARISGVSILRKVAVQVQPLAVVTTSSIWGKLVDSSILRLADVALNIEHRNDQKIDGVQQVETKDP